MPLCDTEHGRNFFLQPWSSLCKLDLIISKFSAAMCFANLNATLDFCILHVFGSGAKAQMPRIYAGRCVTRMHHVSLI